MIIAFDTRILATKYRHQGSYVYAANLLAQFKKLVQDFNPLRVKVFALRGYANDVATFNLGTGFDVVNTSFLSWDRLWRAGAANIAARRSHADLIFAPTIHCFPLGLVPLVVTIHDVIPAKLSAALVSKRALLNAFTWASARFSRKIITVSEYSRKDLIEVYGLPPEKVVVIYNGYDQDAFNTSPFNVQGQTDLLARFDIHHPYIIHHGTVQARKNPQRLIEAYNILLERRKDLEFDLVFAGEADPLNPNILTVLRSALRGRGRLIFTGPVPKKDLSFLVKGAALCVIPSLYEGFCLPMVEAMACGIPTIASNNSCLPEVSGGVLQYFDPFSIEDIAGTIERVIDNDALRARLIRDGLRRASEFNWERCARETLRALLNNAEA